MTDGYFTPAAGTKAARELHEKGKLNVNVRLHRASDQMHYQGDRERSAGRTTEVTVDVGYEDRGIDELQALRQKIRDLGYDAEYRNGNMEILGPWRADK